MKWKNTITMKNVLSNSFAYLMKVLKIHCCFQEHIFNTF